jgi:hypothetical protein
MRARVASVVVVVCALTMSAGALRVTSATPVGSRLERRPDLADLDEALRLLASLHPDLNPKARVTAMIGSLDGQWPSPLIDITLEDEGGVLSKNSQGEMVPTPRGKVYGGVVRFDARRRLQTYSGRTTAGDERFRKLVARLASAPPSQEATLAAFRGEGARFVDRGPVLESCRSLAIVSRAIDGVVGERLEEGPFAMPLDQGEVTDLTRHRLVWNVQLTVKRDGVTKRFSVAVDPWGDVLSVGPYGEAWP